jgi:2-methylcitrate dehydratase PrpD
MTAPSPGPVEGATRRLAEFIAGTRFEDLPPRVLESAGLQTLSMLAAAAAGHRTEAGAAVLGAFLGRSAAPDSDLCSVVGVAERVPLRDALYLNAALSMTLDYDDYLFAGHTGHSAVLAALAVAEKLGLSGRELVTLQVIANEIEGRIGASVLLGPLNGQLWSFIHAAGSAAVYARALGFDVDAIESALGVALLQPPMPLGHGFFGSEAKAILASMPGAHGIDAVELVRSGLAGAPGILDGPQGFVAKYTPRPIEGAFTGLGSAWLTDTLCYKPYPGCAYIDSFVDALLEITEHHHPEPDRIDRIEIAASVLTIGMDALSRPYLRGPDSDPVTLNFSVPYNAAVVLIDGELTPRQLSPERIRDERVWELASRVKLEHDPEWTKRLQQSSVIALAGGSAANPDIDLAGADLSRFEMAFGATVTLVLDDGRRPECAQAVPLGAAGRPAEEIRSVVEAKFAREVPSLIGDSQAARVLEIVKNLQNARPEELRELMACLRGRG